MKPIEGAEHLSAVPFRTLSNPYIQGSKALPIHKTTERVYNPSFIGSGIPLPRRALASGSVQSVRQQLLLTYVSQ